MTFEPSRRRPFSVPVLPVFVAVLAVGIFVADAVLAVRDAVAVLYVVVVMLSASFLKRRGLVLLALACCVAAIVSYLIQHGGFYEDNAAVRLVISIVAIGIGCLLALNNLTALDGLQKQAALIDLSKDAIFTRDMNGVITYWNQGAEALYHWPRAEAVGKVARQLMHTTARVPLPEIDAELLRLGRWEGELACARRDGRPLVVTSRWALMRDDAGRPVSVMETNTDISDRRRAEEDLRQSQAQLAHITRVTTLGEMAASIAHEVNQPLAAVITNGEVGLRLLDRDPLDLAEIRAAVSDIVTAGRRASDIIQRLRALFRKTEAESVLLDVNDLIREIVPLVQTELLNKRASLHLELAPSLPAIIGDRVQLQQVVVNLMLNAAEAMESVVGRPHDMFVRSRLDRPGGGIVVVVEDSGVGIDAATATHLFEPFHTTKPGGMGMGLPICRSIVENHGGKLWAVPNRGPGATFQFTLPIPEPNHASAQAR